jgi:multidrug efflux pump subunit AcrB
LSGSSLNNKTDKKMSDQMAEDMQDSVPNESAHEANEQMLSAKLREASYVVLFIAAVFIVNAMETGSYRTPWPVAITTTLAGLGLFGYSRYLLSHKK